MIHQSRLVLGRDIPIFSSSFQNSTASCPIRCACRRPSYPLPLPILLRLPDCLTMQAGHHERARGKEGPMVDGFRNPPSLSPACHRLHACGHTCLLGSGFPWPLSNGRKNSAMPQLPELGKRTVAFRNRPCLFVKWMGWLIPPDDWGGGGAKELHSPVFRAIHQPRTAYACHAFPPVFEYR